MVQTLPWWRTTTFYQIYPRSFMDSNGDGIGDLPGIISKLDYIRDLGFETIWISPFFASPQQDWGYDISGYLDIAPEYGTLADAEHLIAAAHQKGLKVIFDLVLNHTSIQHPLFIESSSGRENPKSDWYIWQDGKGSSRLPNNWKALPGGSGWHYHPTRGQWYYASFLPFQPDLNFRNPEVKEAMFQVAKFWLNKGVDGFRLDIFHAIFKAAHFNNNPFHWSYIPKDEKFGFFTEYKYTVNQPEVFELARELRQIINSYKPDRFLVGEVFGEDRIIQAYQNDWSKGLQTVFLWDLMDFKFEADSLWGILKHYEDLYPPPSTPVLVLGNHDSRRWIDLIGGDTHKAKLIALLQLTARGIPVVYYGEEIGLPEGNIPARDSLDPVGQRFAWAPNWLLRWLNLYVNRDNCRTPMSWDTTPNAGFSSGPAKPWLPLSADPAASNTADQKADPNSLWNWYKDLLEFRSRSTALRSGALQLLPRKFAQRGLLGYIRQADQERVLILFNFKEKDAEVDLQLNQISLQCGSVQNYQNRVKLGAFSGAVFSLPPSTSLRS